MLGGKRWKGERGRWVGQGGGGEKWRIIVYLSIYLLVKVQYDGCGG